MADGYDFVENDDGSILRITCYNDDSSIIDLTGTAIVLRWRGSDGAMVERNMTIVGAAINGVAEYPFSAGELFAPKMHFGYRITDANNKNVSSRTLDTLSVRKPQN